MRYNLIKDFKFCILHCAFCIIVVSCTQSSESLPLGEGGGGVASSIAFSGRVVSSSVATRADASLLDKSVTHLTATATNDKYVGIFGAYTGQQTWAEYKTSNSAEPPANMFFNQQASVAAVSGGTNALTYSPLRFWPNATVGATSNYEYAHFWAYYPWNAAGDPGDNGIAIVAADNGKYGMPNGMGKIKFTMQADAANQVDFLMSDLKANCNKNTYPLLDAGAGGYLPKPVPFTFHHALAQVRIYAFIRCTDKIVYAKNGDKELTVKAVTSTTVTLTDGTNDFPIAVETVNQKYTDAWGKEQTVASDDKIPDDTSWLTVALKTENTVRWSRTGTLDTGNKKYLADKSMSVSLNNIYTSAIFTPAYNTSTEATSFSSAVQGSATGTSTVNSYTPRTDWFLYSSESGKEDVRVMLNTDHMYGNDGSSVAYFAPGNIMLVVPQTLTDDDVPSVSITVTDNNNATKTARVTYNMLNLGISWESGFIYSYAFIEELMPGDDKVKGPENIIVVFSPSQITDQW